MSNAPILLLGGAGIVGRHTAHYLRDQFPDVPLLIAGRNLDRAQAMADQLGNATAAKVDLSRDDLGLGDQAVSAMAVLFTDTMGTTLRFAQNRGIGHISISPGIIELGPDVAAYITSPDISPVVLGTEWLVGATTIPTVEIARQFDRIDDIAIGALLDEQDDFGPAAELDYNRQTQTLSAALARVDGEWRWFVGRIPIPVSEPWMAPRFPPISFRQMMYWPWATQPGRPTSIFVWHWEKAHRVGLAKHRRPRSSSNLPASI